MSLLHLNDLDEFSRTCIILHHSEFLLLDYFKQKRYIFEEGTVHCLTTISILNDAHPNDIVDTLNAEYIHRLYAIM